MLNQIIQGDCLVKLKEIETESIDAVIADPPYGIDYQSARRTDKTTWKPKIVNDKLPFIWFLYDAFRITKSGGSLVCFCRWDVQETFKTAIEAAGYTIKAQGIWDRTVHGMGSLEDQLAPQHDVFWFATKGKFKFTDKRLKSILRFARRPAEQLTHPTEKPVELIQALIQSIVPLDGIVVDPFVGSGATALAAHYTGRQFLCFEKEPKYVEIANKRLALAQMQGRFEEMVG